MSDSLPRLVEVAGPNGTKTRAHLHFWLRRPDGWWGGLKRTDLIPETGFGSREAFYETSWYCHSSLIAAVEGYENRPVPRYGG